jgi:hypothetical protein
VGVAVEVVLQLKQAERVAVVLVVIKHPQRQELQTQAVAVAVVETLLAAGFYIKEQQAALELLYFVIQILLQLQSVLA